MDWIITLPKKVSWKAYKQEMDAVKDGINVLYFKVSLLPEEMKIGDRLFLLWNGKVKGWMKIVYFGKMRQFRLRNTERLMPSFKHLQEGFYIQRSGEFHEIKNIKMKGFRGIMKFPKLANHPIISVEEIVVTKVKVDDVYDQLKEVYKINRRNKGI